MHSHTDESFLSFFFCQKSWMCLSPCWKIRLLLLFKGVVCAFWTLICSHTKSKNAPTCTVCDRETCFSLVLDKCPSFLTSPWKQLGTCCMRVGWYSDNKLANCPQTIRTTTYFNWYATVLTRSTAV